RIETQRNHLSIPVHLIFLFAQAFSKSLISIRASPYSTGVHYPHGFRKLNNSGCVKGIHPVLCGNHTPT
ncbi:hypothetical protein ACFL6S_09935, partial [Candidatus Poribacteria bacterium]